MTKIALTLSIFLAAASMIWADVPVMTVPATVPSVHAIWGGVVRSVTQADPVKGTKSEIFVKDTAGKIIPVLVTSTTTIWDADAKAITFDIITPHKRVNVIYLPTAEGINVDKSI
jgi:hypothetical protein